MVRKISSKISFDKLLKEYDYLIAHTMFSKDILVNKYQLTESSIKVINHPLLKKPKPFGNIDYGKQFLNVLFFGTLSRYKVRYAYRIYWKIGFKKFKKDKINNSWQTYNEY